MRIMSSASSEPNGENFAASSRLLQDLYGHSSDGYSLQGRVVLWIFRLLELFPTKIFRPRNHLHILDLGKDQFSDLKLIASRLRSLVALVVIPTYLIISVYS